MGLPSERSSPEGRRIAGLTLQDQWWPAGPWDTPLKEGQAA